MLLVKVWLGSRLPFLLIVSSLLVGAASCGVAIGVLSNWIRFGKTVKGTTDEEQDYFKKAYLIATAACYYMYF